MRRLTTSGHAIENLEALAGTGKTTVCGVIADAYTRAGYRVIGATPTARAARELRTVGVDAQTIDAILTRQARRPTPAPANLVVIADENGMSGTRQMAALAEWARAGGAKIIQVGDSRQLQGVPASGAFAEITRHHGAEQLTTVRRQRDPHEIDALADLRAGLPDQYLAHQIRQGRVRITPDADTATKEAAAWWLGAARDHGADQIALITRDNELRGELNDHVRVLRKIRGEVSGPAVRVGDQRVPARRPRHLPPQRLPPRRRQRHPRHHHGHRPGPRRGRDPHRRRPYRPPPRRVPPRRPPPTRLRPHRPQPAGRNRRDRLHRHPPRRPRRTLDLHRRHPRARTHAAPPHRRPAQPRRASGRPPTHRRGDEPRARRRTRPRTPATSSAANPYSRQPVRRDVERGFSR